MTTSRCCKNFGRVIVGVLAVIASAQGALTDLATAPLVTSSTSSVSPNLMFILDDSGSMAWSYMPDETNNFQGAYGYPSSQCNGVYYDPTITYTPPVTAAGASYANASFTAAWNDGYNVAAGTTNLSTSFQPYSGATGAAAYYYKYSGTQTTNALRNYYNIASTFYQECNSNIGSAPGNAVFSKVTLTSLTDAAHTGTAWDHNTQNFANWYSYYRTRMLMMKTAAGQAFKGVDDHFRVGFMTINNNVSPGFLNFAAFDATQKTNWYAKLYSSSPSNSTPIREALSKAGRIYAGKLTTVNGAAVTDPVQYSCQQNFTILSTDGFWNGTDSSVKKIDGTTVMDNQDGGEQRPYYDGSIAAITVTSRYTRNSYSTTSNGCSGGNRRLRTQPQIANCSVTVVASGVVPSEAPSSACAVWSNNGASTNSGVCSNAVVLPNPNPSVAMLVAGSTTTANTSSGGTSNTLADVAEYYYTTDLRTATLANCTGALGTGTDACINNVPKSGLDAAAHQHMTTFTLGLGARGRMIFSSSYLNDLSGDYFDVKNGSTATATTCTWQTAGSICNWPTPSADSPEAIDDLWHAAVNGRGTYFSATNPSTLATALTSALSGVSTRTGSSAAATTSNPNVTSGDNFVFSSTFTTQEWDGELVRQQLDLANGIVSSNVDWSAQTQLDARVSANSDTRTIYTYDGSAANKLKPFLWDNLTAAEQAYFSMPAISTLSQFCATGVTCLSGATLSGAQTGSNLVNFLRGQSGNTGPLNDTSKYYHQRLHVLGDIVNAEARYVKAPSRKYTDAGYSSFQTTYAQRQGLVFVAANDGMLHAFDATTGSESWAYIPSLVLPKLYKLADKNYANLHQYLVDGTPVVGDICTSNCADANTAVWKTILVGGLNGGGRGYYALDITNPAAPKALWEYTDANLGYTYGNPVITKLGGSPPDKGSWVVLVASGYNNVTPGDGVGRLYVLDAASGTLVRQISTGVGSSTTPSGLARISAWADRANYDNTTLRVYAGDLLGNLWRFDINGDVGAAGYDAQLLATLRNSSNTIQPITTKPALGQAYATGSPIIFVGTGRYLGASDLADTTQQSFYGIKDNLDATNYGNPRATTCATNVSIGCFVQQTYTISTCPAGSTTCSAGETVRISSGNAVNISIVNGWYADLPDSGERANTDPAIAIGTLAFNTNVPDSSSCTVGGYSHRYFMNYLTGGGGVVSNALGNSLATRPVIIQLPNHIIVELTRLSGGGGATGGSGAGGGGSGSGDNAGTGSGTGSGAGVAGPETVTDTLVTNNAILPTQRVSWRELITEQ